MINQKDATIYMVIDFENKTIPELEQEVTNRVMEYVNKSLEAIRNTVKSSEYNLIEKEMEVKGQSILKQFIFQIHSREKINASMKRKLASIG